MSSVICLARMPERGKVKTRIAATAGHERALEIYTDLVGRTARLLAALDESFEVEVTLADPFDFVQAQSYFGLRPLLTQQAAGDLGQRLCVAAIRGFVGGARQVILIGSDCPALTPDILTQASHRLNDVPVVFGPATDGGYYLLGLTRIVPELFADIPWGGADVLCRSQERLNAARIPWATLAELRDVDTLEDWEYYRNLT